MSTKMKIAALAAVLAAAGLLLVPKPDFEDRLKAIDSDLSQALMQREVQIDPRELVEVVYNLNMRIKILDFRDENEFNLFHLVDAEHTTMDQIGNPRWVGALPKQTVMVLISNGEKRAERAWKILRAQGIENLYLLAGGLNVWVEVFGSKSRLVAPDKDCSLEDECRRYRFEAALGSRHPESDPDPKRVETQEFVRKVKNIGRTQKKKGGCG